MRPDITTWTWTNNYTLPTANQYVILLDSTRLVCQQTVANSTSLGATAGSDRGQLASCRLDFTIGSTTQNITLVRQIWDSTAWQTVAGGSDTLVAATLYPYGWVPETRDFRMYILAGATAPGSVLFEIAMTIGDRASGA